MERQSIYRRVLRRETHSSRTIAASVTAAIVVLVILAAAAFAIVALVNPAVAEWQREQLRLLDRVPQFGIAAGVAAVLLGIILLVKAFGPGARARRARASERSALLVDDGVYADAVADAVAKQIGVAASQLSVTIRDRRANVRVTPTSGVTVHVPAVEATVSQVGESLQLPLTPRVSVANEGVVG